MLWEMPNALIIWIDPDGLCLCDIWKLQCFKIVLMEIFGLYHLSTFNLFKASCHCFKNCLIAIIVFCSSFVYIAFTKAQIWLVCVQILALFRAWQRVNNTHETLDNSFHCLSVSFIKWICCRWSLRTVILKLGVRWQKKGDFQIVFPLMACSQRCYWYACVMHGFKVEKRKVIILF